MTVRKIRVHRGDFTTIPNDTIRDKKLSLDSLGLLTYLLSRPGDWHFHKTELQKSLNMGEKRIDRMFRELIDAGYVTRVDSRNQGKFETDWHVSPYPRQAGTVEAGTLEAGTLEGGTTKKELTKKDRTKKDKTNTATLFERVWDTYPRKTNRKGAEIAFAARLAQGVTPEQLIEATENYAELRRGQDPKFTLLGATFYGPSERWRDYLNGSPELETKRKEFSVFDLYKTEQRSN